MKKIVYIAGICLATLTLSSCDGFLQKDPTKNPSQSSFWKSKADFDYAMTACYSTFYDTGGYSQMTSCFDNLTNNSACQHDEGIYGKTKTMALGDITPHSGGFIDDIYRVAYKGIARAHQVLFQLENYTEGDITEKDRNLLIGQCKALRGYFYHWLYLCYKEVPLVTELLTLETMYQPKASRADIYAQIINDFDEAIRLLPDVSYSDTELDGRMTPSVIKVLKAKLMIFNAYDENGNADPNKMKEVIPILEGIQGYALAENFNENFISAKQQTSPEIMFSVKYLAPNRTNSIDQYFGAWKANMVLRDLVDEFECTDGLAWGESPLTIPVDEFLINTTDGALSDEQFAEREKLFTNRDKRMRETVWHSNVLQFPNPEFPDKIELSGNVSLTGFSMLKWVQPTKSIPGYATISEQDVVIIRYAHVLLMIAEAENEANGATQKVYDAVNAIRTRAGQPNLPTGLSKENMRMRIRKEWRIETAFEGLHYFHMKQWNTLQDLNNLKDPFYVSFQPVFKSQFQFWPLPQSEIDKANGVLVQNPLYK